MNSINIADKTKGITRLKSNVIIAWLIGFFALGFAGWFGEYLRDQWSLGYVNSMLVQAFAMSSIVGLGILLLFTKRPLRVKYTIGLGTIGKALIHFILGMSILLLPVFLSLAATTSMGWGEVVFNWNAGAASSIGLGFLIVLIFEAFPEEFLFRGYIFSTINTKIKKWKAAIISVLLFALLPLVLAPFQQYILGIDVSLGGSSSIQLGYVITMIIFGCFVQYLRILTNTIWMGVGFHSVFVFFNHLMGTDEDSFIQFVSMTNEGPIQMVYVGTLIIIFIALICYPLVSKKKLNWKGYNVVKE